MRLITLLLVLVSAPAAGAPPDRAALSAALASERRHAERWALAHELWRLWPDDAAAREIVAVARALPGPPRRELFALLDEPALRRALTDTERLDLLLEHKLALHVAGPGALDVRLGAARSEEALADADDLAFLAAHRAVVVPWALRALQARGGSLAALLLGALGERAAIPELRRWFVAARDFYGWETSRPCPVEREQYPARHAYEEALQALTGAPLEATVRLSEVERAALRVRAIGGDDDALYVLYRLARPDARAAAGARFRAARTREERFSLVTLLADHLLAPGTPAEELRRYLGAADRVTGETWRYLAEGVAPVALELRLAGAKLAEARIVDGGPRATP